MADEVIETVELVLGWNGPLLALDVWAGELDRRMFHEVEWPDLPRTMGGSHFDDEAVGTVDEIQILTAPDGTRYAWGRGRFSDTEDGRKAALQVKEGTLRTVSVEIRDGEFTEWPIEDDQGETVGWAMEWDRAVIGAFALERNPAFAGAVIVPDGDAAAFVYEPPADPNPVDGTAPDDGQRPDTPENVEDGELGTTVEALRTVGSPSVVRAAGAGPVPFPARMFSRFTYEAPTRLTISPEGEVTGHALVWGNTYRVAGSPWVAEPCGDLSDWLVGATALDDGSVVATGVMCSDGMHAPAHKRGDEVAAINRMIENTAMQLARVVSWEDEHGLAVHGSTMPGVTPDQAARAMAGCPSVDQRDLLDGRGFVTMGVHFVTTCGFKPGSAYVSMENGEPVTRLVASAPIASDDHPHIGQPGSLARRLSRGSETGHAVTACGCGTPTTCSCSTRAAAGTEDEPTPPVTADLGKLAELDADFERARFRSAVQAAPRATKPAPEPVATDG